MVGAHPPHELVAAPTAWREGPAHRTTPVGRLTPASPMAAPYNAVAPLKTVQVEAIENDDLGALQCLSGGRHAQATAPYVVLLPPLLHRERGIRANVSTERAGFDEIA